SGPALSQPARQMARSKMRLPKQCDDHCIRKFLPQFCNFARSIAITRSNAPHIPAGGGINATNSRRATTRLVQKTCKRLPVVAPFRVIADCGAQLVFTDFVAEPTVQRALIARENHF